MNSPLNRQSPARWLKLCALILVLIVVTLNCALLEGGGGSETNTDQSLKDTEVALSIQQTLAAQAPKPNTPSVPTAPPPQSEPTHPPIVLPTSEPPTQAPAGLVDKSASQPGDIYYAETFEVMEGWWVFPMHGDENGYGYNLFDNRLRAEVVSQDTWVYYIFEGAGDFEDIRIDITVENRASNTNYVGIICRNSDQGWYEANILNTGEYFIYYGGPQGLEGTMHTGGSTLIKTGRSVNSYAVICQGETLRLEINGSEVISIPLKTGGFPFLSTGQVGLSVSTSYAIPVEVDFLQFVMSVP